MSTSALVPAGTSRLRNKRVYSGAALADILLIHGTWTGGWLWKPVRDRLTARGHNVFTPTLTGLGEREHLLTRSTDMETHIRDLTAIIEFEMLDNVVAVGHSYAGMLLCALAERVPEKIAATIFVNAGLPKDGETMLDFQTPERVKELLALVEAKGDGYRVPKSMLLKTGLADKAQEEAVLRRTSDHPLLTLTTPVTVGGSLSRIKTKMHVVSEHASQRFRADHEWAKSQPDWQTAELGTSHFPMLTDPDEMAELIDKLA